MKIRRDRRGSPRDVASLLRTIEGRIYEAGFGAAALKEACAPSEETLWRFRRRVGMDPSAYIDRHLLDAACSLVGESEARISEIARSLGFRDPSTFCKWFKRRRGMSPTTLRASPGPLHSRRVGAPQQRGGGRDVPRVCYEHGSGDQLILPFESAESAMPPEPVTNLLPEDDPVFEIPSFQLTAPLGRRAVVGALRPEEAAALIRFLYAEYAGALNG